MAKVILLVIVSPTWFSERGFTMDTMFWLVLAALAPAIVLCIYIYKKDKVEKEPKGLLLLLFVLGAVICFPAATLETNISEFYRIIFSQFGTEANGQVELSHTMFRVYQFFENFLNIALVEEGLKCLVLVLVTRKNKNFNSIFDGVIYAVFVSLGFAALENILYVVDSGFDVAVKRAILTVPGHMFFAVLMGYYYSFWHLLVKSNNLEKLLKLRGLISIESAPIKTGRYAFLMLAVPVMAHGFFDYCLSLESTLAILAFFAFVVFMYVHCFGKIKKLSNSDGYTDSIAAAWVLTRYPHLREHFASQEQRDNQYTGV